jgi:peroxiredoxin
MKRAVCAALLVTVLPFPAVNAPSAQESQQAAPDFALLSDQWKTVKLSDFRGKKNVLLAVYVLAFTGG